MLRKISDFFNSTFKKVDDVNNDDSIYVHGNEDVYNQRFKKIKISNVLQKAYNFVLGKIEEDEVIENAIDDALEGQIESLVDGAFTELTPSLKTDVKTEILSDDNFLATISNIVKAGISPSKSHILSLEQDNNNFIDFNNIYFCSKINLSKEYNKLFYFDNDNEKSPFIISFYNQDIIIYNIVNDEENINVLKREVYDLSYKINGTIQKVCINTNDYTKSIIVFINTNNKMCITKLNNIYDEDSEWTYIETNLSSIIEVKYSSKYNSFILVGNDDNMGVSIPTICIAEENNLSLESILITKENFPLIFGDLVPTFFQFEKLIIDVINNDVVMTLRMGENINIKCVVVKIIESENEKTLDLITEFPNDIGMYEILSGNQPLLYEIGQNMVTKYIENEDVFVKQHILNYNQNYASFGIYIGRMHANVPSIIFYCKISEFVYNGQLITSEFGIYEILNNKIINFEKVEAVEIKAIQLFANTNLDNEEKNLYNLNVLYTSPSNNNNNNGVYLKTVKW